VLISILLLMHRIDVIYTGNMIALRVLYNMGNYKDIEKKLHKYV